LGIPADIKGLKCATSTGVKKRCKTKLWKKFEEMMKSVTEAQDLKETQETKVSIRAFRLTSEAELHWLP
jgi:hypothetical protein